MPVGNNFKLEVITEGLVPREEIRWIVETVNQLYQRAPVPLPPSVELVIIDTSARRRQMMSQEKELLGVDLSEDFPATHEAWWGKPRIIACLESLKKLSPLVARASVRVAAAHSILHGSRKHYLFHIPARMVRRGQVWGWEPRLLERLLYLVASGVKNLAVSRLLVKCGYVAEQAALALEQLNIEDEEKLLWKMIEDDARGRALYLAALLRPILFAYPVMPYAPAVAQAVKEVTSHLPAKVGWRLRCLGMEIAQAFTGESSAFVNPAFELVWKRLVEETEP